MTYPNDAITVLTKYVSNHKDFKALEKIPTLYHKVEVIFFPMYDSVEVYVTTRTFEKASKDGKTFRSHLWGFNVRHNQLFTIEQTKMLIDIKFTGLLKAVHKSAYPLERKYVLWARRSYKKRHTAQWVTP